LTYEEGPGDSLKLEINHCSQSALLIDEAGELLNQF